MAQPGHLPTSAVDSTRAHFENRELPSGKFVDLMLLMYAVILVFMLMVFMLFMCVVCVSFTGVMTLAVENRDQRPV
jgi:hypothetical protein